MTMFNPFENDTQEVTVADSDGGEMCISNGHDSVSVYGDMRIGCNRADIDNARIFAKIILAVADSAESRLNANNM